MSSPEHRQLVGRFSLTVNGEEKNVDVYEFRYVWKSRSGIELVDRQNENGDIYAILSANHPEVNLEPGEFIVNSSTENKEILPQMQQFPEFEDTGRVANFSGGKFPIWRLQSYDVYPGEVVRNKVESDLHFTGVVERLFSDMHESLPKKQYKDVIAASQLIESLQFLSQALCESDFFSEDAQSLKHNEKWLTKDARGRWKIVRETEI